jgi:hypothetical protein
MVVVPASSFKASCRDVGMLDIYPMTCTSSTGIEKFTLSLISNSLFAVS